MVQQGWRLSCAPGPVMGRPVDCAAACPLLAGLGAGLEGTVAVVSCKAQGAGARKVCPTAAPPGRWPAPCGGGPALRRFRGLAGGAFCAACGWGPVWGGVGWGGAEEGRNRSPSYDWGWGGDAGRGVSKVDQAGRQRGEGGIALAHYKDPKSAAAPPADTSHRAWHPSAGQADMRASGKGGLL
jgi:hypothetical protein